MALRSSPAPFLSAFQITLHALIKPRNTQERKGKRHVGTGIRGPAPRSCSGRRHGLTRRRRGQGGLPLPACEVRASGAETIPHITLFTSSHCPPNWATSLLGAQWIQTTFGRRGLGNRADGPGGTCTPPVPGPPLALQCPRAQVWTWGSERFQSTSWLCHFPADLSCKRGSESGICRLPCEVDLSVSAITPLVSGRRMKSDHTRKILGART